MAKVTYATAPKSTDPIKQIQVQNGKGYLDLVVNLNKNGKAVRISTRDGSERVHITLAHLDEFINDLKLIAARGVKTSAKAVNYSVSSLTSSSSSARRAA